MLEDLFIVGVVLYAAPSVVLDMQDSTHVLFVGADAFYVYRNMNGIFPD